MSGGIVRVDESRHRDGYEVRVTEVYGAVAVRAPHGLDDEMRARDLVHLREIEAFQDVEGIDERDTARGWRRARDDTRAAIVTDHGCALDDLAPCSVRRFVIAGIPVAVVRIDDDVYAIGDVCSHANVSLSDGEVDADERTLECWKHGSAFSLETGEPTSLPATRTIAPDFMPTTSLNNALMG